MVSRRSSIRSPVGVVLNVAGNKYRMVNMGIAPIKTQRDYRRALKRIENFAGVAHEFGIALLTPNAILRRM
jgi:hypothetical protein